MSWQRSWVLIALLAADAGCSRERAPDKSAAPANPVSDVRELLHETAFDLVSSPRGALLAWVAAAPSALHVARFDAQGNQVNARFGEMTGADPARRIQLALRFYF